MAEQDEVREETTAEEPVMPKPDVYALVQMSVAQFAALAWIKMGLQADPFSNKIEKDLEQARAAVDMVGVLAEKLLPRLHGQPARDLQSLLTDLRLNFVRQMEGNEPTEEKKE